MSFKAHFDGETIELDEPRDLPADVPLLVTILGSGADPERDAWADTSRQALARAWGDDEPEYSLSDIKR